MVSLRKSVGGFFGVHFVVPFGLGTGVRACERKIYI